MFSRKELIMVAPKLKEFRGKDFNCRVNRYHLSVFKKEDEGRIFLFNLLRLRDISKYSDKNQKLDFILNLFEGNIENVCSETYLVRNGKPHGFLHKEMIDIGGVYIFSNVSLFEKGYIKEMYKLQYDNKLNLYISFYSKFNKVQISEDVYISSKVGKSITYENIDGVLYDFSMSFRTKNSVCIGGITINQVEKDGMYTIKYIRNDRPKYNTTKFIKGFDNVKKEVKSLGYKLPNMFLKGKKNFVESEHRLNI